MKARIIGIYRGSLAGPMVIALGGVHGNEPAGVEALEALMERLRKEPSVNPGFQFSGTLLALRGHCRALEAGKRFLREDLNRLCSESRIRQIRQADVTTLAAEEREIRELLRTIEQAVSEVKPKELIFWDIHTNSAEGGIFALPSRDAHSQTIARQLHAPVVNGMLEAVEGSVLRYLTGRDWGGIPCTGIAFEAGRHQDPESTRRALAATINCLRSVGCVRPEDVNNEHDELLMAFSRGLPTVNAIVHRHHIEPEDHFIMLPGFRNFDFIPAGTLLAHDRQGAIHAPYDCRILMPLYQEQGEDGFFLIREQERDVPAHG